MKPVMLTKAQTDMLVDVIGEVFASTPEEWAASTGRSKSKANRDWSILDRALRVLMESYPRPTSGGSRDGE